MSFSVFTLFHAGSKATTASNSCMNIKTGYGEQGILAFAAGFTSFVASTTKVK